MSEQKFKALGEFFLVREIEGYDKSTIIHVDFTDRKNLYGEVISVGDDVKNIKEGDIVVFTDGVQKIEDVLDYPVYRMQEDAVLARRKY